MRHITFRSGRAVGIGVLGVITLSASAGARPTEAGLSVPTLNSGTVDSYPFFLLTGEFLNVMTTPLVSRFGTPDTVIRVLDPGGVQLVTNDDGGSGWDGGPVTNFGSILRMRAPGSGMYTVQVTGFPDFGFAGGHSESGEYGLTTSTITPGDPGDFSDAAGDDTPAGAVPTGLGPFGARVGLGTLAPGDIDFFALSLTAGDVVSAMTTSLTAPFSAPDTLLGAFDAGGTLLTANDDGGSGWDMGPVTTFSSGLRFVAPADGVYFLAVTGFGDSDFNGMGHKEDGDYALTVSVIPTPGAAALGIVGVLALRRRR